MNKSLDQTKYFFDNNIFPGGYFTYYKDNDEFIYISENFLQLLGYSNEEFRKITNNHFTEMIFEEDRVSALEQIEESKSFNDANQLVDQAMYRMKKSDGSLIWFFDKGLLLKDEEGREFYSVVVLDISYYQKTFMTQEILLSCLKSLNNQSNFNEKIKSVLKYVLNFFGADRAYIYGIDQAKNIISNDYEVDMPGIAPQSSIQDNLPLLFASKRLKAFENGDTIFKVADISEIDNGILHSEYLLLQKLGIHSIVSVPIYLEGKLRGFLGIDNPKENIDDSDFLIDLCFFICNDLEKSMLTQKLHDLSYIDSLSKLYNRNSYNDYLKDNRGNDFTNIGVIFADLNGLKYINDNYGHEAGDAFIYRFSHIAKKSFDHDKIFRISGDEFVIISINSSKESFLSSIKSLKRQCKQGEFNMVSVGYVFEEKADSISELVSQAEKKMHVSKNQYYKLFREKGINYRDARTTRCEK